ncbi:MAG: nitric oxide synthase oxygenase [Bacteroidota bacterium]
MTEKKCPFTEDTNSSKPIIDSKEILLLEEAGSFLSQCYQEFQMLDRLDTRLECVVNEILHTGTYTHTPLELEFGAKVAWRNSNKCIGRLMWNTLHVRDRRHLQSLDAIFEDLKAHLKHSTNEGKIRSTISIYKQKPNNGKGVCILNSQLIRYAAYELDNGEIIGDPQNLEFTQACKSMGWESEIGAFNVLPLILQEETEAPKLYEIPAHLVLEVPIIHPDLPWFEDLNLKWHALPVIANMNLRFGGIEYTAAPFSGWYMLTEIAVRNLADQNRYNALPLIAKKMGMNTKKNKSLWKDKALVELNLAVMYSFEKAGAKIVDHHSASEQFMKFVELENKQGRKVNADWAWIIPPTSGSTMEVFHQQWEDEIICPNFFYRDQSI